MTLKEMIYRRRSCRSYTGEPVDGELMEKILSFDLKPLYPDIRVRMDIVSRNNVKCICPWIPPQLIAVYSQETEGYLENVGFLFQQMDLYLQSLGLGVCWLGMGKMNPKTAPEVEGMKFVILLAFGHPKGEDFTELRKDFRRKELSQIADREDTRLEPARLAPSSVNSQPWYFVHEGEHLHVYRERKAMTAYWNAMDMGIALAHLYAANGDSFRFWRCETAPGKTGHDYIGTIAL